MIKFKVGDLVVNVNNGGYGGGKFDVRLRGEVTQSLAKGLYHVKFYNFPEYELSWTDEELESYIPSKLEKALR